MDAITLGRSGLRISPLILGTAGFGDPARTPWSVGAEAVWPIVRRALDCGITTFDTGATYGGGIAETRLGEALVKAGNRQTHIIITKLFFPDGPGANDRGLSRKHLIEGIDRSLSRLQTDHVDLLMIHRWDAFTPLEETLRALEHIVTSGRALYVGASSMSAWRLMKALGLQRALGHAPMIAMQGHYNLLYREEEREMLPLCREEGLGYLAWSPLARGLLAPEGQDPIRMTTDRLLPHYAHASGAVLDAVREISRASGQPAASLALSWLRRQGAIPVIGPSAPDQVEVAARALATSMQDVWAGALEAPYRPCGPLGFDPRDEQP